MRDLPLGRIFGFPLRAQPSALFVLALFAMLGARGGTGEVAESLLLAVVLFGSILVHELGHAFVGRAKGLGHIDITLHGFGGFTRFERPPAPRPGLLVTIAGPGASLALGALALGTATGLSGGAAGHGPALASELLWKAAEINLFWGAFNLLPMYPLDGGLLTWHALSTRMPRDRALRWAARLGVVVAVGAGLAALLVGRVMVAVIALLSLAQTLPIALERGR